MGRMVVLLLYMCVLTSCFLTTAEPEINYLPEHFIGKVAIIFGQKNGQPKEYFSKRRIYRIPECGILKTRFSRPNSVIYDSKTMESDVLFVYVNSSGSILDTLHFLPDVEMDSITYVKFLEKNKNKVFVMQWSYGGFSIEDSIKYDDVEFYAVDSLKNLEKYPMMDITTNDIKGCR